MADLAQLLETQLRRYEELTSLERKQPLHIRSPSSNRVNYDILHG